jgi:hypothetical protein
MSTLIAGAALLLAVGCGGGSSSSSSSTQAQTTATTATTPPAETTSSTASTSEESSTAAGTAAPGKSLSVGETATVPYQPPGATGSNAPKFTLEVEVTAIEKGSLNDFNGIKLDSTEKASTPTYIKAKLTNVGAGNAFADEDNPAISVEGVDSSGETVQGVVFFGEFPRCEYKEPPKPFTKGKSYETCITILVPNGVSKAAYTGTEKYVETPLTWK